MADTNLVYPYELQGGQRAVASEVMANFEAVQLFAQGINTTINEFQAAISDLKTSRRARCLTFITASQA